MRPLLTNKAIIKNIFFVLIVIPGVPFILLSLGYAIYTFWPRDISEVINIDIANSTSHISISVHGVKDNPETWSNELQIAMSNKPIRNGQNISLDWRPFSENPFTCAVTAKRIGNKIGAQIAKVRSVKSIHAIGHSCGAFVVFGLCEEVKTITPSIKVQTTYLAPVSVYAGFFWRYGVKKFGSCGNFSDAYIDKDDAVPGSNQQYPHAHTFDVTQLRIERKTDELPHNWPTKYYLNSLKNENVPLYINTGDKLNIIYPTDELSVLGTEL